MYCVLTSAFPHLPDILISTRSKRKDWSVPVSLFHGGNKGVLLAVTSGMMCRNYSRNHNPKELTPTSLALLGTLLPSVILPLLTSEKRGKRLANFFSRVILTHICVLPTPKSVGDPKDSPKEAKLP